MRFCLWFINKVKNIYENNDFIFILIIIINNHDFYHKISYDIQLYNLYFIRKR